MEISLSKYSRFNLIELPPYLRFESFRNVEEIDPLAEIFKTRELIIIELSCSTALTHQKENLAIKFNQLSSEVIEDCIMVSSPTNIALHPSYQKIIGLGEDAIPLLIKELNNQPTFWFWALQAISGINPVPKYERGKISVMVKRWKRWAKENNYV